MLEEHHIKITNSSKCRFSTRPNEHARLADAAHAVAASLAECRDLCEWFGVNRPRDTIHNWYQSYIEHYD